ncbi:MAG: hypothetical protein O7C65_11100, partial [Planctomycetota bacterium]|nr:hypothetical protein [Planctomycetota bacterium]
MTVGPKRNALTWAMTVALSAGLSWAAVVSMDVEQLAVSADRIVIGDVVSVVSYRDKDTNLIMSRVVIDVSDDLKGRGDDRLTLELWGGSVDGVTLRTSVTPTFFEGDHVLLFLEGPDNRLVGEFQGAYLTDGNLAVQMHGGFQRFIPQSIHPLRLLIDKIRGALPRGQVPGPISPYEGDFTLDGEGGVAFVLLPCDWTWQANPMGEVYRINANCVDGGCGTAQQQIDAINPGADTWN